MARIDKAKLTASINAVAGERMSGVQHGATMNVGKQEAVSQNTPAIGRPERAGEGVVEAERRQGVAPVVLAPTVDPADAKTERVAFLCTPTVKKHLKRLAIDKDKDVSKLILEALAAKGYLP